jgi:phage terminase large subunit-like protein
VIALAAAWSPNTLLVEDRASGQSLIQELRNETSLPVLPVSVDRDKVTRAQAVTPMVEAGRVFLPASAAWVADYLDELSSFPAAPHDDQVDSTTMALNWMRSPGEPGILLYYRMLHEEQHERGKIVGDCGMKYCARSREASRA